MYGFFGYPLYIAAHPIPDPTLKAFTPKPRLIVLPAGIAAKAGVERDHHIAREIARLRLGYSGIWRNSLLLIPRLLGLPGNTLARAETYSIDALAAQLAPDHALDALLIDIFGSALYPGINRNLYRQRWQAASRPGFEQAFSDQPLARERYLALLRQRESPAPYPSNGRLF